MRLLFPACIRCFGNTKLIVTTWRALSSLKRAPLLILPPPLLDGPAVTLCVHRLFSSAFFNQSYQHLIRDCNLLSFL